ncbi:hypothetical protein, partial [Adlercreutzia sp. ZJ473]|uniref:hypothetical protein n=1 Tax=Adlercreutzia sp. ZJ473 TaxID=2722822 RepID=UPI001C12D279
MLDVETNGLKSKECDLLSISIYKPDDGNEYDRLLPLDLDEEVYTTDINGIRKCDLRWKKHLTQAEVNELFDDFELGKRTILHYGSLDPRFIRDYFARHGLVGFEHMRFFNFKHLICSTGFSDGSLTKDNLCDFFGIAGVAAVHSGLSDCKLEWELFKKLDGRFLLARIVPNGQNHGMWRLAVLNPGYIVPVSYLTTFNNLSRIIKRPYIRYDAEEVYSLEISGEDIRRFPTNFSGMIVENLIDSMLGVTKADNSEFLAENSAKNELLGYMHSSLSFMPMSFNGDGTVTAARQEDKEHEKRFNMMVEQARPQLIPLARFLSDEVFHGSPVISQELVVDDELGILALCDLSTDDVVLEIKTSTCDPERYAEQLYYGAKGRTTYLLGMEWDAGGDVPSATFTLKKVRTYPGEKPNKRRDKAVESLSAVLSSESIEIVQYANSTSPVKVRCKACNHEWEETYPRIRAGKCVCPTCHPERRANRPTGAPKPKRETLTPEQALAKRARRYAEKVAVRSGGKIEVDASSYVGGKDPVRVR